MDATRQFAQLGDRLPQLGGGLVELGRYRRVAGHAVTEHRQ
jgi:hypothetical protein